MPFTQTEFPGLLIFEPIVFDDSRGYFFESYNTHLFSEGGVTNQWVQDNQSSSIYGVIRGLHYQLPPFAQTKLVRVLRGKILDVVVDIRKGSPTYGKVFSIVLSAKNKKQLLVPKGFAHGFSVLSKKADVLYKCDGFYNKQSEGGIVYNDAELNIDWRIPYEEAIVSDKDKELPTFAQCNNTFDFSTV
ncbi:MAG: dTDP-4-dehydrorhamnose 3,5-epimerase [Bacteroidota bacterium]|jgi:dTDP-4-dehydrorhamnose 3,5-epimerase